MSYLLTRIRRALAESPEEELTSAVLAALIAHWASLFAGDPVKFALLGPHLKALNGAAAHSEEAQQRYVTASLAEWEAKRAAFQLDATLGGPPGRPGPLWSADWGTHWILFDWKPPETGGPVWGYRIERSEDNRNYYLADMGVEPEIILQHQPQNVKFYYRVVPFNGWGDGPPSPVFGIMFDPELVDEEKRNQPPEAETEASVGANPKPKPPPA
jgi:hypothetical protein